ncbi:2-phospho-L-lactate guanylyltransferase [Nakamurella antarctica]|uniref:2-phospho-L-lactate guanylyltransferase n=1 Tax=Nakamurella antarctica TaxID=1902245 RepID=A0A3G8ZK55_9ACTN|nr:2-phospho-L-lactate guanylyltransferase [Nakamurella antarctica]AZI57709.1 2-phospho-L-lactate guanylyltransferase [Nakamurella antarctica]
MQPTEGDGPAVDGVSYCFVIPFKSSARGKSRIDLPPPLRARLAFAMLADTVAALVRSPQVHAVLLVVEVADDVAALETVGEGDGAPRVRVIATSADGLNPAIEDGVRHLAAGGWAGGVAAVLGDLPGLTPRDVAAALFEAETQAAQGHSVSAVPDALGTGTTVLIAAHARDLVPRFGAGSYAAHLHAGATGIGLSADSGLRRDVDVIADLTGAPWPQGLGPATSALVAEIGLAEITD